jgi:hypothetical protein
MSSLLVHGATQIPTHDEILALVNAAIVKHRERLGLPLMDDALPGQPDNVFLIVREHLFPV